MKKILGMILLVLCPIFSTQAADAIRVLTFNIRLSYGEIGKRHEWKNRRDYVADIIRDGQYDFVGVQEAIITPKPNLNQVADLQRLLPDYRVWTRSRVPSKTEGESTPILYRADRWEMDAEEHGVFWLSDDPDTPGSNTWNGACPRTVVWGKFHELQNGQRTGYAVYFVNTHFDHVNKLACRKSAVRILDFLERRSDKNAPAIVTGDLNQGEDSPSLRYLLGGKMELEPGDTREAPFGLVDTFRALHPTEKYAQTFHGFCGTREEEFHTAAPEKYKDVRLREFKIDFILATPDLKPVSSQILRGDRDGLFPSDHYPVEAVLKE